MIGAIFAWGLGLMMISAANPSKAVPASQPADDASLTNKLKESQAPWKFNCSGDTKGFGKKDRRSVCRGSVVITHDDLTIKCDTIETQHDEKWGVKKITCLENVIIKSEQGHATAEKAEFFNDSQELVLTGNPVLYQEGNVVRGEVIKYNVTDETFAVSKIRATIDRSKEATAKKPQAASQPADSKPAADKKK